MSYIKFTRRNIRRTPFQAIAASMVMFLTFFALITFVVLAAGSQITLRYFENKPQVIAFFKEGTTENDIQAISDALKQTGSVTDIKYITKEEALKIFRERYDKKDPAVLEYVSANILPASLEISTANPEDLKPIAEILQNEPVVEEVQVPDDVVKNLTTVTSIIRAVGGAIVIFLSFFGVLIILMVIGFKIRLRRDEIEIMRLIGASSSFIRMPFILEGMFYAILGAVSAWVFVYLLLWYLSPFIAGYFGDVPLFPVNPLFMLILLGGSVLLAIVIGAMGAMGAVRRYLQV